MGDLNSGFLAEVRSTGQRIDVTVAAHRGFPQ
jgi:hypothetical protein